MKIAMIGYGPATIRALEAIEHYVRALSGPRPDVTVISPERTPYAPMFLIKYISGQLSEKQFLLVPEEKDYNFPFRTILGKRVLQVKEDKKSVILDDGQDIEFDKLLIASGASAIIPPIKGLAKQGVFPLSRLDDARKISQALDRASEVIVIGAGAMGMEASIAFNRLGKRVKLVELAEQILPQALIPNLAIYVQHMLEAQGIEFCMGDAVSKIVGKEIAAGVVTRGGREIKGDLILLTAGVMPNIDFVKYTAVKTARGILVNEEMETSVSDIYAAGDVAETQNFYGAYEVVFNWYSAVEQGWIAGCNLMGQQRGYQFRPMLSALKEVDTPVLSIGRIGEGEYELLSRRSEKKGVFEDIYVRDNLIDCYQAIGIGDKAGLIYSFIKNRKPVDTLKTDFLSDEFNITGLIP